MNMYPVNKYRRNRVPDGVGGFTENLSAATTIYGFLRAQDNKTSMIVDLYEDVLPDDIIGVTIEESINEALYSVASIDRVLGQPKRILHLERIDRPITP